MEKTVINHKQKQNKKNEARSSPFPPAHTESKNSYSHHTADRNLQISYSA